MELDPNVVLALLGGFMLGLTVGMSLVVYGNRRFIRNGGHCACACDRGCC